ncbi:MAG: rod-binding protein [Candidatus Magnetoovum sp. WYHC-5]|nr:rod-binding protein [Candidatus Magnetoovum sp. WYHC-5]
MINNDNMMMNGNMVTMDTYKGLNNDIRGGSGGAVESVAKEMEALFTYELLKVMRQANGNPFGHGTGADSFLSMFDTELSRYMADKGVGIKDMVASQLSEASKGDSQGGLQEKGVDSSSAPTKDVNVSKQVAWDL